MKEIAKAWEHEIDLLHERLAGLFRRAEPRQRSLVCLKGLLGTVERKNGWQLAERIGEAAPDGVQHLLERAQWDPDAARNVLTGVPCGWITGDEVYGGDRPLRLWLESRTQPFLLAVKKSEPLWW
ncbi:DDE superfamily endonuclease [Paraburkholderia sp. BL6669N2]|uniref:transposase n=1 Tax=Paraburkholderia sp. BL6669N2 TaxID=1938807 RepID=UPI000E37A60D|nr:DDE superfamily endonuclease [Paraburkholderia sp. BL6669N2]